MIIWPHGLKFTAWGILMTCGSCWAATLSVDPIYVSPLTGPHPGHQGLPVCVGLVGASSPQGGAHQRGHALVLRLRTLACIVGRVCRWGQTPLMYAGKGRLRPCVYLLLSLG